jgi:glutamine synthetase
MRGDIHMTEVINVLDIFGMNVFNDAVMSRRLPKGVYKEIKKTIDNGGELSPQVADVVASVMRDWAIERGATHYTHWFQPMTGITAEKHDAFIIPDASGKAILDFTGKELVKGEPDASSFPSGGIRATFEARGYTAWDCTSPAFIREDAAGVTLVIPTAFCSYTGEALDKKTPLLRSMEALNVQALRILRLFGNTESSRVISSVGPEQEYFLIDKSKYLKRKDLIFTGRTLFGAMPPKGQELEDHYFGSIKERIAAFMKDANIEMWKLGIPAKTQHNEVAPAQHEIAPYYGTANIATDHNQLVMETLKKVAERHNLVCLLHEKPFAGVNGSGKHNNWSIGTDDGVNLLNPGHNPHENLQFLLFLVAVLNAVDTYAPLLRLSAANPGNDHRLGANEAPPAIISVFLGEQLDDILAQIETGILDHTKSGGILDIGVASLPNLNKDATDRNRTSPFAFTGNKFEFRMVPSSGSIAGPNFVLNTIVAEILSQFADELEKAKDFNVAVWDLIRKNVKDHKKIIFAGNNYSDEWVAEAAKRGLPNIKSTVESVAALTTKESVRIFEKHHVLNATELHSRSEITYENYIKVINIEARTMIDMTSKQIIPAVVRYATSMAKSIAAIKAAADGIDVSVQIGILTDVSNKLAQTKTALANLVSESEKAVAFKGSVADHAAYYRDSVFPMMTALRAPVDELEMIVDQEVWPFPTYGDLMFNV